MGMGKAPKIKDGKIVSINPATLEELGSVEIFDPKKVPEAVDKARAAQPAWAARSLDERCAIMRKFRDLIVENTDDLAELISQECGKTLFEALSAELVTLSEVTEYYTKNAHRFLKPTKLALRHWGAMGRKSSVHHKPKGVMGVISPWNYPFFLSTVPVVRGLLAGNAMILKPSEVTPLVGVRVGELFHEAGVPEDVFQVLSGTGETGAALVESGLDGIEFTGSVGTGKKIMAAASKSLTPVTLELGGKDPMIILEDTKLGVTVEGATWSSFQNSGQTCASVERIYVHESIFDKFIDMYVKKAETLRQGVGLTHDMDIGSMTSLAQLELVDDLVNDARKRGATIHTGGERIKGEKGYFYPPTIVTGVDHTFRLVQEEVFGPVVAVMPFKDDDEAVGLANDSKYGLTASVWTSNVARAQDIAEQLEFGTVTINDHLTTAGMPDCPWGGVKDSGIGRTMGASLDEFCQLRHIHANDPITGPIKPPWWYPYSEKGYNMVQAFGGAISSNSVVEKIKGFTAGISAAMRK